MTMRKIGYYSAVYILLILSFAFLLVPIIWVFLASLTEPRQITSGSLWPGLRSLTLDSYRRTLGSADVRIHLRNSFVIASMTTIATLLIATLAAYSTSRFARISGASITVLLQGYISGRRIEWGLVSASTILSIAPTVILFALTQRWLVAGLMSGAVKE